MIHCVYDQSYTFNAFNVLELIHSLKMIIVLLSIPSTSPEARASLLHIPPRSFTSSRKGSIVAYFRSTTPWIPEVHQLSSPSKIFTYDSYDLYLDLHVIIWMWISCMSFGSPPKQDAFLLHLCCPPSTGLGSAPDRPLRAPRRAVPGRRPHSPCRAAQSRSERGVPGGVPSCRPTWNPEKYRGGGLYGL